MKLDENIKNEIVKTITTHLKVIEIILFGSYANGKPNRDSDIDLVVVLNEHGVAKTFKERIKKRQRVSHLLFDMRKKIAMDILVYSIDEWQTAKETDTSFSKEIRKNGVRLV